MLPGPTGNFLARFREGDAQTLETVYCTYVGEVIGVAGAVLRACAAGAGERADRAATDVADVVQEAFARAFAPEARRRFDGKRPLVPYLLEIARHVAIDHWRAYRRSVPMDVDQLLERRSIDADAGRQRDERDERDDAAAVAVVGRYVQSLDGDARRVHEALYERGLSQREAAAVLGVGRQVIRTLEGKLRLGALSELDRAGLLESHHVRPSAFAVQSQSTQIACVAEE